MVWSPKTALDQTTQGNPAAARNSDGPSRVKGLEWLTPYASFALPFREHQRARPITPFIEILEFNCPMCGRSILLSVDTAPPRSADVYRTVTLACRAEDGGECGWKGFLLVSEGVAVTA